jgi:hypothetical protein
MGCRNDPEDPRKCERCGAFLWVAEEGWYCGDCGALMPCTMRVLPPARGPLTFPRERGGPNSR